MFCITLKLTNRLTISWINGMKLYIFIEFNQFPLQFFSFLCKFITRDFSVTKLFNYVFVCLFTHLK